MVLFYRHKYWSCGILNLVYRCNCMEFAVIHYDTISTMKIISNETASVT